MGRGGTREEYIILAEEQGIDFSKEIFMLTLGERRILDDLAQKYRYKAPQNGSKSCGFFLLLKKAK